MQLESLSCSQRYVCVAAVELGTSYLTLRYKMLATNISSRPPFPCSYLKMKGLALLSFHKLAVKLIALMAPHHLDFNAQQCVRRYVN